MPDPLDAPHAPFPPDPGAHAPPAVRTPPPPGVPDPGSRRMAVVAWVIALLAFAVVAGLQNFGPKGVEEEPEGPPKVEAFSEFTITGKVLLKLDYWAKSVDPGASGAIAQNLPLLTDTAQNDAERLAVTVAIAEIRDEGPALDHLADLAAELEDDSPLWSELEDLRTIYSGGSVDAERQAALENTLGYFGRVAVSRLDDSGATRERELGGGGRLAAILVGIALFLLALIAASFVCFVLAIVRFSSRRGRRARFVPPAPGGSVLLETYAVFVAAFLVMILAVGLFASALPKDSQPTALRVSLIVQWTLVLVPFWPLLRGVRFAEWRRLVGLHAGRGLVREAGAGVFLYLASLPVYVGAVLLSLTLMYLWWAIAGEPESPPKNEVFEMIASGDAVSVVLLFLLATVWAPFVEETVFRGSLFRHFRSRVGVIGAAFGTAALFAFMHGYGPLLTPPLITLGVVFALMREWRGSIVAPMVAHWMHNTGSLVLTLLMLWMLSG